MLRRVLVATLFCMFILVAFAQTNPLAEAATGGFFAQAPADQKPPAPPAPTELELSQIENIQLRMALLNDEEQSLPQRRADLQMRYGVVIRKIESEHPGYVWNPQVNGLVPKPAEPQTDEKKPDPAKK